MSRADRRHQLDRAKARARRKLARWGVDATPDRVGVHAGVRAHCSCAVCRNRRHSPLYNKHGGLTMQERRALGEDWSVDPAMDWRY